MRTSLRNTKSIIVAAAVLHNWAIEYRVPELHDTVDDPDEEPDDPEQEVDANGIRQPRAGRNMLGDVKRRQIIDHFPLL